MVSILGDTKNAIGCDPEYPGQAVLVLKRDFGLDCFQSPLSMSAAL